MNWKEFERAAPDLAQIGLERFGPSRMGQLGTLRADGAPRISPIELWFEGEHLLMAMMWRSKKALDLLRDPRCIIHSVVTSPDANEGEFKLRGRAMEQREPRYYETLRKLWGAGESTPLHVFSMDIESAALVDYDTEKSIKKVKYWDERQGLRESEKKYP